MNSTIEYYNKNADKYIADTINVEFDFQRNMLLKYLSFKATILDLGCGSGRDTKVFLEKGYEVYAIDGSKELCVRASQYIGQRVMCKLFSELDFKNKFDGIWACASLLHLPKNELREVLKKIVEACKPNAKTYLSFKYGDMEIEKEGRHFTYLNETTLRRLIEGLPIKIIEECNTQDARPNRKNEQWYNVVLTVKSFSI